MSAILAAIDAIIVVFKILYRPIIELILVANLPAIKIIGPIAAAIPVNLTMVSCVSGLRLLNQLDRSLTFSAIETNIGTTISPTVILASFKWFLAISI